jgi:TonB family protein
MRRPLVLLSLLWLVASAPALPGEVAGKRAIFAPRPKYPYEARAHHVTGAGLCILHVRFDGTVRDVEMVRSTGHAILDDAALEAFRRWQFEPGAPPKVKVPFRFVMDHGHKRPKT